MYTYLKIQESLFSIHPNALKTHPHKNLYTDIVGALCKIAKTCPRCPSVGEWINWPIQAVKYYSVLKRNEPASHVKTWGKLTCISLSERSQSEKATYWLQLHDIRKKRQSYGGSKKIKDYQGLGEEGRKIGRTQRIFRTVKLFCRILNWDMCYMFVKTQRMSTTKSEL